MVCDLNEVDREKIYSNIRQEQMKGHYVMAYCRTELDGEGDRIFIIFYMFIYIISSLSITHFSYLETSTPSSISFFFSLFMVCFCSFLSSLSFLDQVSDHVQLHITDLEKTFLGFCSIVLPLKQYLNDGVERMRKEFKHVRIISELGLRVTKSVLTKAGEICLIFLIYPYHK